MGSNFCPQDIEDYCIPDQNRIKEIQDDIEVLRKPRGMVSFPEEAEAGSLLVDTEMTKHREPKRVVGRSSTLEPRRAVHKNGSS